MTDNKNSSEMYARRATWLIAAVVAVLIAVHAHAAQSHAPGAPATTPHAGNSHDATASGAEPAPVPPDQPYWAGPMLIIILGMFLAAAVVGPIIRSEMPDEVPVPHGHDEVVGHEDHGEHEPGHGHGHGHHH